MSFYLSLLLYTFHQCIKKIFYFGIIYAFVFLAIPTSGVQIHLVIK